MKRGTRKVWLWRWAVFLLAGWYAGYMILTSDYSKFGGPFRFLTIWALLGSFFCASRALAWSEGRTDRLWYPMMCATAVINAMVVFLYWRLFLEDPASVTRNGELGELWLEMYIHALGPLLQWIEALFVSRAFRRPIAAASIIVGWVVGYLAWAELFVQPLNSTPVGAVTTGLPYPFLNSLEFPDRLTFYAINLGTGLALLLVFFGLQWVFNRMRPAGV